jgi:Tfp pilus assembly major pilin PilA
LLGAAYSRARESTCDRHGLACSGSAEGAARALAALAAGSESWKQLNVAGYIQQSSHSSGFWMSYHELTGGYPWLTKRVARVMDADAAIPGRNGLAYLLAAITPHVGRTGGGFGLIVLIYVVAILAAVALPAYQDYTVRAALGGVLAETESTRDALGSYYESNQAIPASLEALGVTAQLADGSQLSLDTANMVLTVSTQYGEFLLIPAQDEQGGIVWECTNGEGLRASQLPSFCYASE